MPYEYSDNDPDVIIERSLMTLGAMGCVGGIALILHADLSIFGLLRGLCGVAIIAAALYAFVKFWRGD